MPLPNEDTTPPVTNTKRVKVVNLNFECAVEPVETGNRVPVMTFGGVRIDGPTGYQIGAGAGRWKVDSAGPRSRHRASQLTAGPPLPLPSHPTMDLLHRAVVRVVVRIAHRERLIEQSQAHHVAERPELARAELAGSAFAADLHGAQDLETPDRYAMAVRRHDAPLAVIQKFEQQSLADRFTDDRGRGRCSSPCAH